MNSTHSSAGQYAVRVNHLSHRMLELARKSNWPEVARLESERSMLIEKLFSLPDIREQLQSLADTLAEVIELDRECIMLGEQARNSATRHGCQMQQGHKASIAYLDNIRG